MIKRLKKNKSPGLDNITAEMIKAGFLFTNEMVRGRNVGQSHSAQQRQTKAGTAGRKSTKIIQASATAQASPKVTIKKKDPTCLDCGKEITEEVKSLQCDKCGQETAWKCITCVGITPELYDMLTVEDGPELKWFCESCLHSPASCPPVRDNHDKLEEIVATMGKLMDKLCHIENRLDNKADVQQLTVVVTKMRAVESNIDNIEQEIQEIKQNKKTDETQVIDCVEKVLTARSKESLDEEAEKAKRKSNVIIHGLPESGASDASERQDDDLGLIASMLHEMKCDSVEAVQAVRLGRKPDTNDSTQAYKPRPLKLVLKTEDQKIQVLTSAKNLRLIKDGGWKDVFLHADLTMKEREKRRQLVSEMKERKEQGETDLIIVNGKIVRRVANRPSQSVRTVCTPMLAA